MCSVHNIISVLAKSGDKIMSKLVRSFLAQVGYFVVERSSDM